MEIIKNIGAVVGLVLSCLTLLTLLCKPIRKKIGMWIKQTSKTVETTERMEEFKRMLQSHIDLDEKRQNQMELLSEGMLDLLRDDINRIYFKYIDRREIPSYEKQNLINLFEQYKKMGGNTYVHNLYDELMELPLARGKERSGTTET